MNEHYKTFVEFGRQLAIEHKVNWTMRLGPDGMVAKEDAWNLTRLVNDSPPPTHWIRDFGYDEKALEHLNSMRIDENISALLKSPLSIAWQDFIKAAILEQLLFRRNTTSR